MAGTTTPAELAQRYGVKVDKIHAFIKSGELVAINVASSLSTRPRWRIPMDALADFENRRSAKPAIKVGRPRRQSANAPEYV